MFTDEPSVDLRGNVTFKTAVGAVTDASRFKVVIKTDTYEPIYVPVIVTLVDKQPVALEDSNAAILTANELTYGEALSALAFNELSFVNAEGEPVYGTLSWEDDTLIPTVATTKANWIFTPDDEAYLNLTGTADIVVNKAPEAPNMPAESIDVGYSTTSVNMVGLPLDWNWKPEDNFKELEVNVPLTVTVIYAGADAGNYEIESVQVTIIRSECEHADANHDHVCDNKQTNGCDAFIGTHTDSATDGDHVCDYGCGETLTTCAGGTATCKDKAVCTDCGEAYGEKNPDNHVGGTKVVGAADASCTVDGYTGDTHCVSCDAKLASGQAIPAPGHTIADGKCDVCGYVMPTPTPSLT